MYLLRVTSALLALALFCLPAAALPNEEVVAPTKKLAQAAMLLPPDQRDEVRHKALAIILLAEFGRLLPPGLSADQWDSLENLFLDGRGDDSLRRQQAASMPLADTVTYDGGRLVGGGFARIDNIIGTNGRPIALDRRLPTKLIPLNEGEENLLRQASLAFSSTPAADSVREKTDALYRARLGSHMVGDGIFYRPYAGRTDDLYYRLVQEHPRTPSEMNFYAIAESLPGRHYHPLTGIGTPASVPAPWFSVSEILSGGGLLAVENFKNHNPRADVRNPFFGFAARVLPFLGPTLEKSRPGEELNVSKDVIRNAIQNPRRFTPKPVEPIFHDPGHFFGSLIPPYIYVAHRMSRAEMAEEFKKIDFGTPLPDVPSEPVGNEVLTDPAKWTKAEFFQELPALLKLDSAAEYNPDKDLFTPSEASNQQSPPPTQGGPGAKKPGMILVQSLPSRAEVEEASPSPTPSDPVVLPPADMPLVATLPTQKPSQNNAATPTPTRPANSEVAAATTTPSPAPKQPILLAKTEFPITDIATLSVPSLPVVGIEKASSLGEFLSASPISTLAEGSSLFASLGPASLVHSSETSSPAPKFIPRMPSLPGATESIASTAPAKGSSASPTPTLLVSAASTPHQKKPSPLAETEFPQLGPTSLKAPFLPIVAMEALLPTRFTLVEREPSLAPASLVFIPKANRIVQKAVFSVPARPASSPAPILVVAASPTPPTIAAATPVKAPSPASSPAPILIVAASPTPPTIAAATPAKSPSPASTPAPILAAAASPTPPTPSSTPKELATLTEPAFPNIDIATLNVPLLPIEEMAKISKLGELLSTTARAALPESPALIATLTPASQSPQASKPEPKAGIAVPAEPIIGEAIASATPPKATAVTTSTVPEPPKAESPDAHYLAVVTPDIADSEKYLSNMAANDILLSKNAANLNRVNCYLKWLDAALNPVEFFLGNSPSLASAKKNECQAAATATETELNSLLDQRESLEKEREKLLAERGNLRSIIEGEPLRLTTAKLDAILGRHIELANTFALSNFFSFGLSQRTN